MKKIILLFIVFYSLILKNKLLLAETIESENLSPLLITKEKNWSNWQKWIDFPFEKIQVGISNQDLGRMLDFEYSCFGSVGDQNNQIKQEVYWYRIAEEKEKIGTETYRKIEVGCWVNNEFKSTITVWGIE